MKIKKYVVASFLGFSLVEFIWRSGAIKALALPISLLFLVDKSRDTFWALFLGLSSVAVYFLNHGYSGSHDLKSLLLILHFLIPVAVCRFAMHNRKVFFLDIIKLIILFLIISILFLDAVTINTFDAGGDRFRGFFLFVALALMQVYFKGNLTKRLVLAMFVGACAFMISGSRQDSLILLASGLIIASKSQWLLIFIILIYATVPIITFIFSTFIPDALGTIAVRAGTVEIAFNNFNMFGNGMIPPVSEFLQANDFNHFFVPADVMYFGSIYETGLVIFFIKIAFCFYIASRYWGKIPSSVIIISCSASVFDYNLTHMAFELAASAIVFKYLRRA